MWAAQHQPFQRTGRILSESRRFSSTALSIESSRKYCLNLLLTHDYASYLQSAFIPSGAKDAHLAIRALNIELALIPDTVSNQHARIMRMQFWKDAVDHCYKGAPKQEPVSVLLAAVLANGKRLTKSFFQTMISERVTLFSMLT
jgi:NADH dehydrogenase [ubiquinone] 1 alpha subcomplex assembly factor 6